MSGGRSYLPAKRDPYTSGDPSASGSTLRSALGVRSNYLRLRVG